ncbi:MAG: rod shape-determining protein MreC [Candidatus Cloacimonetes bacterium]|nr:rod shape-determining protein MreC [Candidatus Cloacimonadota bacterium]
MEKSNYLYYEPESLENKFIIADVIGCQGDFHNHHLVIDKGKKYGLEMNYPVLTKGGIVGKIVNISNNYSIILPFDNPHFKLAVMTFNTKLQGLLETDLAGNSFMTLLLAGSEISLGDSIVTSNLSTIFPAEHFVGIVSKIQEAGDDVHMKVKLKSSIIPESLNKVAVLFYKKDLNYETEINN